jgi:hypothetical protein
MLTPWAWPVRVWEAFNPPDNIQNGGRPGGNASRACTGWDLAAVTRVDLLRAFVLCQGVTASVYSTCRVTNGDEYHSRRKQWRWTSVQYSES